MARQMRGTKNDDVLNDGGVGRNLVGGPGDDTYEVGNIGTRINEHRNGGDDSVEASVSYKIGQWLENLILTGSQDLNGYGNDLNNLVVGNEGNNEISGFAGDDTLSGGKGSDTIDGGDGEDTALFARSVSDYGFEDAGDGKIQVVLLEGSECDIDVLSNVEWLAFDDGVFSASDLVPQTPPKLVAHADNVVGIEDNSILIDVQLNDEGEGCSIIAVSEAEHGEVWIEDGKLRYVPSPDWSGIETLSYTLGDKHGQQSTSSVTIEVLAENDNPVAISDSVETLTGRTEILAEELLNNDYDLDGDNLVIISVDPTTANGGSVVINEAGNLVYEAPSQYQGNNLPITDSFSYVVSDGFGGEATSTVEVTLAADTEPGDGDGTETDIPDNILNALLRDGTGDTSFRWNADDPLGEAVTITFSFAEMVPDYYADTAPEREGFQPMSQVQRDAVRDIIAQIESFTNISFKEVADGVGDISFGTAALPSGAGWAYSPSGGQISGDVWISNTVEANLNPTPGSDGFRTLLHEIGHSLGLQHPHDTEFLSLEELHGEYTVMSYMAPDDGLGVEPSTYMIYDIAALQFLYGANADNSSGNDVYDVSSVDNTFMTISDSGGWDVLDASEATRSVVLDLNSGSHSSVGTVYGWYNVEDNLGIAIGTTIEEAIGGAGDDTLIGNSENNILTGGEGADVFVAGADWGVDSITDFQKGIDKIDLTLAGLQFDDLIITEEGGLLIVRNNEGELHLSGDNLEAIDEEDFLL